MKSLKANSKRSTLMDQYFKFSAFFQKWSETHNIMIAAMALWEKTTIALIIFLGVTNSGSETFKGLWIFSLASYLPVC
jgi:hypothetical protein